MLNKLKDILEYYFEQPIDENTLIKDLNLNELDYFDLLMDIEDEFEISIDEEEFNNLKNIKELINYIENEKSSR